MKTKTLEVNLTDVSVMIPGALTCELSRLTAVIRARKNPPRDKCGKFWRKHGLASPLDSWRHLIARYLRRILPRNYWVYVGGHHVAVMLPEGGGSNQSFTVARFLEASPV